MNAAIGVPTPDAIVAHLESAADALAALVPGSVGSIHVSFVREAEMCLRTLARGVDRSGTGDGRAVAAVGYKPCSCGFLSLAAEIEGNARDILTSAVASALPDCRIEYITAVSADARDLEPFRVNGLTDTSLAPRTVTLVVSPAGMRSRDLWHVAYTFCHELLCHAFQGAIVAAATANAHPSCHWSEGWMDTLVFDVVSAWIDDLCVLPDWLPLRGEDARGELRKFHEHRYVAPLGLAQDDVFRRRRARDAYRALATTLLESGIASTATEAQAMAQRFAVTANLYADCHRLKTLASRLRIALLNPIRPEIGVRAAAACLAFLVDHDLTKLEGSI